MTYNFESSKNIAIIDSITKYLEEAPATSMEIAKHLQISQYVSLHFLRHLEEIEQVYVCEYANAPGKGFAKVFALGNLPSVNKKDYLSPHHKPRIRRKKRIFVPKMDIAASWLMNPTH